MRMQPGKARSLATVGRHYESSRLGGQLMASAYERMIPILSRSTPSQVSRRPAAKPQEGSHPRHPAIGA